jgi:hypothetical protein
MKTAILVLLVLGLAFAGQIVNVGETFDGTSSTSGTAPADDSGCYNLHVQCLRDGCASAQGTFNEQTQGCDGGDQPAFASAVGQCSDAQGECVMGTGSGYSDSGSGTPPADDSGSGAIVPIGGTTADSGASQAQGGLCPLGFALVLSLAAAYAFSSG